MPLRRRQLARGLAQLAGVGPAPSLNFRALEVAHKVVVPSSWWGYEVGSFLHNRQYGANRCTLSKGGERKEHRGSRVPVVRRMWLDQGSNRFIARADGVRVQRWADQMLQQVMQAGTGPKTSRCFGRMNPGTRRRV